MFGYVVPIRRRLSQQAKDQYHADYCGLCRCLGKRYGFTARFLVSYDMTFLYGLLASGQEAGSEKRCFCPANPFCKKQCRLQDGSMEFAADVSVLLSAEKLRDTVADGKPLRRLAARLLLLLLGRKERRAKERLPRQAALISRQTGKLAELERESCPSVDRTADTFAAMLRDLIEPDIPNGRILGQILYHTGRYLYLVDALDDLQKDVKSNNYNPLRFRYALEGDRLREDDQQSFLLTVEASIDALAAAFDLLEPVSHGELLENIILYGMPSVMQAVALGRFHRNRSKT